MWRDLKSLLLTLALVCGLSTPAWAAVARTGTPSQVDASGGNGSTSVTVPGGATGVIAFWAHFDANTNTTLATLTLNGASFFPAASELGEGATTDETGVGVAFLHGPSTGSQTLAWTWSGGGARTEGGEIILVYVSGSHASAAVRGAATDATVNATDLAVAPTSQVGDLVFAFAESFTPTDPALSGTVFIDNGAINSHRYDVSEITATAGTTAVTMTNEDFSGMAAIAIIESAGGGGATSSCGLSLLGVSRPCE